jgi:hypothetical protein
MQRENICLKISRSPFNFSRISRSYHRFPALREIPAGVAALFAHQNLKHMRLNSFLSLYQMVNFYIKSLNSLKMQQIKYI